MSCCDHCPVHVLLGLDQGRPGVRLVRRLIPFLGALLLVVACSPDKGFATRKVSREDYGVQWPLTVDGGVLACEPGDVATITVDGRTWPLDGVTEAGAYEGFLRIWERRAGEGADSRKDLSPLTEDAYALCD